MKVLSTILHKEFFGYFKNYTAYIVLAIYLLLSFAATFYSAHFFDYDNTNLRSFFIYQPEILNILLPAITMKMWAEERKQGTLEFLLTQPICINKFVYGKFLASVIFSLCMLFMVIPFVVYLSYLINYDILNIISSFIGVALVMILLCAIGCTISSLNSNAIVAYLSSVFVGWILENTNFDFIIEPLKSIVPLSIHKLYGVLNFRVHYQNIIEGQLSFDSIIYFATITILTLWLNVVVIEKRRS